MTIKLYLTSLRDFVCVFSVQEVHKHFNCVSHAAQVQYALNNQQTVNN